MNNKVNKIIYEISIFAIIGIICFSAMFYLEGYQASISKYALYENTSYFFNFWLITLIIGAYRNPKLIYTIPAIIGLLLFDANPETPIINTIHNIFAFFFFGITTASFVLHKPSRLAGILMLLSYLIYFYDMFIGEIITITIIYYNYVRKIIILYSKREK